MSKATPGRPYTVKDGDTLTGIAIQAYGVGSKWRTIWQANESRLRSGDPNLIYPGEVINVPGDVDAESAFKALADSRLSSRGTQDLTVVIDGLEVIAQSASVVRSIDTAADGWALTRLFDPDDTELFERLRPYTYAPAQVYLGGELVITGYVYKVSPNTGDRTITVEGWSKTADLIDSTLKVGTLEQKQTTLQSRAEQLALPHAIKVDYRIERLDFDRVTADPTETKGEHLGKLCKQRGALLTSSTKGDLVITRAATTGEPVAALVENTPPLLPIGASYDARQRFASYRVIGRNGRRTKEATSVDNNIKNSRFTTTNAPDARLGDITAAAEWERNRQAADSMGLELPVMDWYDDAGELWKENTLITLQAPTLFITEPATFLIRSVRYELTTDGRRASLSVVPPSVYTQGALVEPWFSK